MDKSLNWTQSHSQDAVSSQLTKVKAFAATDLNLILQRNLFDPSSRSNSATIDLGIDENVPRESATSSRRTTGTKRILLGTVGAGEDSLALMQSEGEFTIFHLGDELPDGGIIENIFRNYIQIRERDKSLTDVLVAEDTKTSTGRAIAGKVPATSGIEKIDETHWVIPKRTADATRENLSAELRLAQMQPRITNGKTDGFIVRRLKRTSILNKLGLKRGDVVLNINNIPLDGPESGLQIFQQLREARQISLAVERKGEAMTFSYELN
ncbi:hypothetical protein [Desulfuromusa kysingii]|nr:hypothetical protein [Desulfuromusa kysingii]